MYAASGNSSGSESITIYHQILEGAVQTLVATQPHLMSVHYKEDTSSSYILTHIEEINSARIKTASEETNLGVKEVLEIWVFGRVMAFYRHAFCLYQPSGTADSGI